MVLHKRSGALIKIEFSFSVTAIANNTNKHLRVSLPLPRLQIHPVLWFYSKLPLSHSLFILIYYFIATSFLCVVACRCAAVWLSFSPNPPNKVHFCAPILLLFYPTNTLIQTTIEATDEREGIDCGAMSECGCCCVAVRWGREWWTGREWEREKEFKSSQRPKAGFVCSFSQYSFGGGQMTKAWKMPSRPRTPPTPSPFVALDTVNHHWTILKQPPASHLHCFLCDPNSWQNMLPNQAHTPSTTTSASPPLFRSLISHSTVNQCPMRTAAVDRSILMWREWWPCIIHTKQQKQKQLNIEKINSPVW